VIGSQPDAADTPLIFLSALSNPEINEAERIAMGEGRSGEGREVPDVPEK